MPRIAFFLLLLVSFVHADEYDDLRLKWRDIIVGSGYDTADSNVASRLNSIASAANSVWSSMDKSPTRTFLWSDQASTTDSSHITNSYTRLRSMAYGYATPGCSLQGNATLLADIISGLDWLYANRYGPTTAQYFNWWDWEIGVPLRLTDTCVLLYDQLGSTRITNYCNAMNHQVPVPDMTGANLVWKAHVVGVRACLVKDSIKLTLCRDAFSAVFPYVTTGDGYYTDGSFVQHNYLPSTASYGGVLISTIAPTLAWLSGSTWAVTDPAQSNLFRWVFDSYEPIIYNGNIFDLVRGRDIGNANVNSSADGMMASILQIAQVAPPADAARMKSMIKEWALADYTRDFVSNRSLPTITLAKEMMNDPGVVRRGELIKHYTFAEMDRVIHLGAGHGFGLSMCSTRITNFESINGENLRGWFTGDGQTILYNGDLAAFGDSYWATVNHYRLPGVTADVTHSKPPTSNTTGPRALGQSTRSPHSWVGGATLGAYGAAGMQFKGVGVTLTGKKSWFMFDDEIVCLGSGITSTDSRPIETTIEQRKLNSAGTNAFTANGTARSTTLGTTETMSATSWAHLAGSVTGSDIGYYFPTNPTIKATREARTGAWSDIDSSGSTTPITRNYLRMTLEHGNNPNNATYQYVLLPGRNTTRTGHYAAAPQVTVLANNANVQAVTETTLGITAANFWTDTAQTIGGITSNKKASVLVRDEGPFIDVSVSDPTHLNTTTIALQIALDGGTLVSADPGVTVTQSTPSIVMNVSTTGAAGKTFKARFYKLTPQSMNLTPEADSYVYDATASLNSSYGTQTSLTVKKAGTGFNREGFLRFDLPAGNGVVLGATLKLACLSVTVPGVNAVAKVDDNSWTESGITWNNQPAAGPVLSTWTPVALATSNADVTSVLPVSGLVSFKVFATTETSNGIVTYGTKENSTAANHPQLSLIYGHTPPEVSITTPADGAFITQAGNVTLTADAVATDGAITSVAFYDGPTLLATDISAPYSITPSLTSGPHFLKAIATDANGLSRTSFTTRVDVANPPAVKAATGSALNVGTAWTSAAVPVNPDTATWNANSLTGAMTLGSNLSWAGLIVKDPAASLAFNGTQTLTLGSSGIDMSASNVDLTLNHPLLLGENQTWNVGANRTLTANGQVSGPSSLTKTGAGNLILAGANIYTDSTTIDQGTLAFTTTDSSLAGGLVFGATAATTTAGILDLTPVNATFGDALLVNTNSTTAHEIRIGAAQTLTINNTVQIGVTAPTVASNSNLTLTGGGTFNVATPAAGSFLVAGANGTTSRQDAILDLAALKATTLNTSTTGILRVGPSTNNSNGKGMLLLPTPAVADTLATTTLTAATLAIGDGNSGGGTVNNLTLGTGLTKFNADTLNVGTGGRDIGQIIYGQAAGDLIIRAADGTSRAAAINVASLSGATANAQTSSVDFSGHDADILVTALNVGNQPRTGTLTVAFNFGQGDNSLASKLDVTSVNIGLRPQTTTTTTVTHTARVNLSGGTVTFGDGTGTGVDIGNSAYFGSGTSNGSTIGELNISGGNVAINNSTTLAAAVRLGTNTATGNNATVTASMNLTGGTTTLGGDIIRNATSPRTTSTLKVSGGTLDMGGNDIGSATGAITFTTESGTLSNVKSINGTAGLTKTTANTLTITGTNTYSGATTVSNGTLALSGSLTGALTVNSGTLTPLGLPATAGAFSLSSSSTYQTRINGVTAGTLYDQLTASGSVTLSGPLNLIAGPGLSAGTSFRILNKTSAGAISGTFTGKPEGSVFTEDGYTWIISYLGGDGNDVVLTLATPSQAWRFTYFGTIANTGNAADTFDANNDGEPNLLEYATAQNPTAATLVTLAAIRTANAVEITYTRSKTALTEGVIFTVEWSDTLAPSPWSATGVTQIPLTDNGTLQSIKATVPASPSIPMRFARLKVTSP